MANLTPALGPPIDSGASTGLWWRGRRILSLVTRFFLGQGALQGINILVGLYLVRVLSIESYAQFGLTVGFQQTVGLLMDLGFASTIIPLVGARGDDRGLVGRYVRAAKHLRDRAFWILAPFAAIVFIAMMFHHHWSWYVQTLLICSVLLSIYSSGKVSYYGAPLFLYGKLKEYYLPQTAVGGGRLLALLGMRVVGALNGWTAAAVSALGITVNGELLQRETRNHIDWPETDDPKTDKEVLRYIMPAIPAMIFAAFQLQSSVFLISIFGQTAGIAEVSALGRLSQLFGILGVFNAVVIEPSMARLAAEKVAKRYAILISLGVLVCAPIVILSFAAPGKVLWLLGSKYSDLQSVVGWAMLGGSVYYLALLIWVMNRARKWVFWSGTALEIGLTLLLQILFILLHGVRTTPDAIYFGFVSALGPLTTQIYVMFLGMFKDDRKRRSGA
jgi:hypothetical protein